ncbi:MAG: response regulator [Candidatus Kerfeldbacteria bacterium]|jgi:DNA-binding response OmpR family regulator
MNNIPKVLLVEDDLSLMKIYSNKLKISGFDVLLATTGDEGLRKAQVDQPNIVLLDLILPGMDGFLVLEEIKKDPLTENIPVVILSNLGQPADIERGKRLGAIDYLVKSDVSLLDLVAKVKKYII